MVWRQFESPGDIGERMVTRPPPKNMSLQTSPKKKHGGWKIKEVRLYLFGMYPLTVLSLFWGRQSGISVLVCWNHMKSRDFLKILRMMVRIPLMFGYVNDLWTLVRLVNSLTFIACGCFGNEDILAALAMHFLCEEGALMYSFIMKPTSINLKLYLWSFYVKILFVTS